MQADPLQAHKLFHSTDLDEARERVAAVFCPHRLDRIGRGVTDARQHHLAGDRLSLNYIQYGAKTLIAPGELERFYLLQIPLSGGAAVVNGTDRYYSSPAAAAVLNPHLATTMIWEEGTRQVLVQIDRQALMDHLSAQLGAAADRPLTFTGAICGWRGRMAIWLRALAQSPRLHCAGALPISDGSPKATAAITDCPPATHCGRPKAAAIRTDRKGA
jgi:hypothetical protein